MPATPERDTEHRRFDRPSITMPTRHHVRRDLRLFWVSCCMLFFEILLIRWLSSEIRIFAYFHNLVLLFAFLGIGLGAALTSRKAPLPLAFVLMALLVALLSLDQYFGKFTLRNISAYLSSGADFSIWIKPSMQYDGVQPPFGLPVQALALIAGGGLLLFVVALITVFFIPFGQLLGRLLNGYDRPLRGYGVNLAGSLAGIWLFHAVSLFSLPPAVWFALGGFGSLVFVQQTRWKIGAGLLVALSVLILIVPRSSEPWTIWSPYQKLVIEPAWASIDGQDTQYGYTVRVNSVGYMEITNYSPEFMSQFPSAFPPNDLPYDHYNLPYRFVEKLADVLVVGSGAGNDTAGALRNGAQRVTAVDIDPRIIDIGRELHPEAPYTDPRVTVVNDDARSFFRKDHGRYDLIVFGLLDSHTLSSSYSNVRLDNYVYTTESFQDAARLLKPEGVMVVLFHVADSDEFIGARIQHMLTAALGQSPVGFYVVPSSFRGGGGDGFVAGNQAVITRRLADDARLQAIVDVSRPLYEQRAAASVSPATDDWPYLYLADRSIPALYFLVFGMLMYICLRGLRVVYKGEQRLASHFFFLGAGFMLLEVQNVSKLALLFGTTWTVNAIVISAILVMALLANTYVMRVRVVSLTPYYGGLLATLLINFALPLSAMGALPSGVKELLVGLIMGLPIFFAGIIFSTLFSVAENRASALASNLLGAMAGGMLESLSFVVGIKALLILALALYLLSLLTMRGSVLAREAAKLQPIDVRGPA